MGCVTSTIPGEPNTIRYIIDGQKHLRRREVCQNNSSTITEEKWYRWEGWEELAEYSDAGTGAWDIGTLEKRYVPGLAEVHGSNPGTGTYRHYSTDHLGSVRAVRSGADKALLARYDYLPYGESRVAAGMALNKGFTGHTWDPALKQYHAPFRYYSPSAARWNMRDPLGYVDGPNVYGYVMGNPTNFIDPKGLNVFEAICNFFWPDDDDKDDDVRHDQVVELGNTAEDVGTNKKVDDLPGNSLPDPASPEPKGPPNPKKPKVPTAPRPYKLPGGVAPSPIDPLVTIVEAAPGAAKAVITGLKHRKDLDDMFDEGLSCK